VESKSLKEYSVVFLVEGEKLSVLLRTRSAKRLSLHLAAIPTPNIAELVPSVHNHGFCGGPNTSFQGKQQHVHAERHLVTGKEISSKINFTK